MNPKIIQQGAEAVLIREDNFVLKRRAKKGYRINELDDKLRKQRTRKEAKLLERARKFINVPAVKKSDDNKMEIEMEFISGLKLSENLDNLKNWKEVCLEIGKNIAKLHDADIIHGDLTTSNMILVEKKLDSSSHIGKGEKLLDKSRTVLLGSTTEGDNGAVVYFIDFGLGFHSSRIEDKAVDLHLIKQALEAKHFQKWEKYFEAVLKGYELSENLDKVMKQFKKVEKRGRYKRQY